MKEQLKIDFNKIQEVSNFSDRDIEIKKSYLNKFIKNGFPNRKQENWKFLDISQIIKKNIGDLSFFNDYSLPNEIDPSIFVSGLEHNKIIFINGRIEKIDFNYEDQSQIEINDEIGKNIKSCFDLRFGLSGVDLLPSGSILSPPSCMEICRTSTWPLHIARKGGRLAKLSIT